MRVFAVVVCLASLALGDLVGLPTVPFDAKEDGSYFDLSCVNNIIIDSKYAHTKDHDGWTLIPPSLSEFASTFAKDWSHIMGRNISIKTGECVETESIFLTVGNNSGFQDVAGRWTSEAYAIVVEDSGVTITGASPLGTWWGTRSVLQQAVLNEGKIPVGKGVDSPGWNTRGIFLDAGRHFYPSSFLVEMCNWISFWKQNTFHLHLSDNLYNNEDIYSMERILSLYAAFRPWSDDPAVAGLNKRRNESYTREDLDHIQSSCAARGVTVIPEIEAPGHALVITQWKQNLGLDGQFDLLNLSNPDSTTQMETIWKTFLPWFHSKVVHIGADEYTDDQQSSYDLGELYNAFVNKMNSYIPGLSGKSIRIWGTYPPLSNYTDNIAKNVTVQHWEYFEDNPLFDYINNNISVINSDDSFYIVQKYSTSYPQVLNATRIFHGSPDGSAFAPNIFDQTNATNNPTRDSPYVVGHIAAQWNDYGPNTSTFLEAYYPWKDLLPALADKQWGGKVTQEQYESIYSKLQAAAPAQNLDRTVKSKGQVLLDYQFAAQHVPLGYGSHASIQDLSGNGYNAKTNCSYVDGALRFSNGCSVSTPLKSKGQNYTLSFSMRQTSRATGPLFTGPDSELRSGNGTSSQLMLVSAGNAFALNYSLPVGEWIDASMTARGNRTFFSVNNGTEMEFLTKVGVNGERFAWARMAVVAPLAAIGGGDWEGDMRSVKLVDYAA